MTKNEKVTAGLIGGLALVLAVGAYEMGTSGNRAEAPTVPQAGVLPSQPVPTTAGNPSTATATGPASPVVPPTQWHTVAPANQPARLGSAAVVPSQTTAGPTTLVRTPSGALVPTTTLRSQQATLAPQSQTTVNRTEEVVPAAAPASTVTTTRTTAYVPESTTEVHRVYVHRQVHYRHYKSDKIHVSRAVKHSIAFAVKMPGRLRL